MRVAVTLTALRGHAVRGGLRLQVTDSFNVFAKGGTTYARIELTTVPCRRHRQGDMFAAGVKFKF